MRILVTGGAGFIGSHVTEHLVHQGHEVLVFDRFTYAGKRRNLAAVLDQITLVEGDIRCPDAVALLASFPVQAVVHMAAETHVDRAIANPQLFVQTNVYGTTPPGYQCVSQSCVACGSTCANNCNPSSG